MRASKKTKTDADSVADSDSEFTGSVRMDGTNADVFANIVEAGGYIPHHKEPPRYIRIKAHNKKNQDREFNRMFLAQELVGTHPKLTEDGQEVDVDGKAPFVTVSVAGAGGRRREKTGGAIWATEFSKDGKYFAAAGRDAVVRIWAVISTQEERRVQEEEEAATAPVGERLSAPVFLERPVCEFVGHTNEVLDLSWSKNNFLLSTSMDKTVRLWHISRKECLCTFKHKDLVTKVTFHPMDDRFFLAGSLDMTLRLWSIPDKNVAYSVQLPDLITAVAFTPDGKIAIAGMLNGLCMFYETEGLKFNTQIHAKSSRGKNSKGSKITGIQTLVFPPNSETEAGEVKVMISSNDSRIRVYNLKDGSLDVKFKGHENACTQISASFSDDAQYIISGSEDRKTFIWKTGASDTAENKDKQSFESFDAHGEVVTTAVFAPTKTRQLLASSGDPIYDLCNPPPVTLLSSGEYAATTSQTAFSEVGSNMQNEEDIPGNRLSTITTSICKKPEESPAYIARKAHHAGKIVVTTDDHGIIKVFRQDCAYSKRRNENWESGSVFSKRTGGMSGLGLGRTPSIMTRASGGSNVHSRRGSLSTGAGGPLPPGVVWGGPGTPKISSDAILSWRQNIGEGGRPNSIASSIGTPARSERSMSPSKNTRTPVSGSRANLAADARKQQYKTASPSAVRSHHVAASVNDVPNSPTSSVASPRPMSANASGKKGFPRPLRLEENEENEEKEDKEDKEEVGGPRSSISKDKENKGEKVDEGPSIPSFSFRAAENGPEELRLDPAGASYSFWNLNRWKGIAGLRGSIGSATTEHKNENKGHTRTASDAVIAQGGNREHGENTNRRRSIGSSFVSALSSPTSTLADEADMTDTAADKTGRAAALKKPGYSLLSTMTTNEDLDREGSDIGDHLTTMQPGPYLRAKSVVSKLSSELTSEDEGKSGEEGEGTFCQKCGGRDFKTRRVQGRHKVSCRRCGSVVEEKK